MTWDEIALRYPGTDKSSTGHDYMPYYQRKLEGRSIRRVLEIGVGTGDSLRMWSAIWPYAEIVGVEIKLRWDGTPWPANVTVWVGDATRGEQVDRVHGPFDLIVDDASHELADVTRIVEVFAEKVAPGGLYVVEDTVNHDEGWPASTEKVAALLVAHFGNWEGFPSALDAVTMTGMADTTADHTYLVAAERG